jgi:hypothetical protein
MSRKKPMTLDIKMAAATVTKFRPVPCRPSAETSGFSGVITGSGFSSIERASNAFLSACPLRVAARSLRLAKRFLSCRIVSSSAAMPSASVGSGFKPKESRKESTFGS